MISDKHAAIAKQVNHTSTGLFTAQPLRVNTSQQSVAATNMYTSQVANVLNDQPKVAQPMNMGMSQQPRQTAPMMAMSTPSTNFFGSSTNNYNPAPKMNLNSGNPLAEKMSSNTLQSQNT